tara:strand:- start:3534 stop:4337 length:804 start_codon:yes stop_codon:yes gene_type:complete
VEVEEFKNIINSWYLFNRRDLPWRKTFDPYSILVSEIMLQQTQVSRVLNFYDKFLNTYPNFSSLAGADNKKLFELWNGLGYWKRALNLRKIAEIIQVKYGGVFPNDIDILKTLPGVGEYTSAALKCFIYNYPIAFVETNIRKVLKHFFFPDIENIPDKQIYRIADLVLDRNNPREWNYALMDYGSSELRLRKVSRNAKKESFVLSNRYYRGVLIRYINQKGKVSIDEINILLNEKNENKISSNRIKLILESLVKDQLIIYKNDKYFI